MPERYNTSIEILIKKDSNYYYWGRFDVTTPQNEFYYRPSQTIFSKYGIGTMSENQEIIDLPMPSFDHISFHGDGNISFKRDPRSRETILTREERLNIDQTGFAYLFWDAVSSIEELPLYTDAIEDKDIVKEMDTSGSIILKVCLIASTNLLNRNIELTNPEEGFIDWENRGTANPQRMLSFIFCKYTLTPPATRRIFIPKMRGITADKRIEA